MRGVLAGAVGGLLAFVFARIFAEPQIQKAIERGRDAAQSALDKAAELAGAAASPDVFSRTVQANVGLGVGLIFFGTALGAMFAVAYMVCLGRVGNWNATLVAAGGFIVAIGAVMTILPPLGHLGADVAAYGEHATETPLPLTDGKGTIV